MDSTYRPGPVVLCCIGVRLTVGVFYRYPGMGVDAQALVPLLGKADNGAATGIVNIIAAFLHFAQNNRHFTLRSVFYSYFSL